MKRSVVACSVFMVAGVMLANVSVAQAEPTCCPAGEACPPEWWPAGFPFPEDCIVHPPLVRISAEEAFDAYQSQELDGNQGVVMFDVRTPEEVYWVGAPAQVNAIHLSNGSTVVPDYYKAVLQPNPSRNQPQLIEYELSGKVKHVSTANVASTDLTPIAYNVPVEFLDPATGETTLNPYFGSDTDELVADFASSSPVGVSSVIFFCRSGTRSSVGCYYKYCPFSLLDPQITAYEVEAYDEAGNEINGYGGFESTAAANRYLGYRGFPGRVSSGVLITQSVSFKDFGLPITIGQTPMTESDDLSAPPWVWLE